MNVQNVLKPCPFCSGENVRLTAYRWVRCDDCNTTGPTLESGEAAIENWNKVSDAVLLEG